MEASMAEAEGAMEGEWQQMRSEGSWEVRSCRSWWSSFFFELGINIIFILKSRRDLN